MASAQLTRIQVRRFTQRADDELYDYLHERNIAREFLHEIDLFFMGHPEIAAILAGRELLDKTSTFSPLEAYKLFVRGYTRPARYVSFQTLLRQRLTVYRYVDGIIKKDYFRLDRAFHYCPQLKKYDPELDEFFGDFGPRTDIFDAIDRAVLQGIRDMEYGHDVPVRLRILICVSHSVIVCATYTDIALTISTLYGAIQSTPTSTGSTPISAST
jgi:hypothetical protein